MKSVIYIDPIPEDKDKPVEFTHVQGGGQRGWLPADGTEFPGLYDKVVYLGKCKSDGDLFACYRNSGNIYIIKGHLNSGKY